MEDTLPVLHVWPGHWGLPTINADCLAVIIYAQIVLPGEFEVEECVNPDTSPNGQLPYLTHGLATVSTFTGIAKYLSRLRASRRTSTEEEGLTPAQRAQQVAWLAYVEAHFGDLVAASFYSVHRNYWTCVRPTLAAMLPVPQKYFVPDRMRHSYSTRLAAAGFGIDDRHEIRAEEKSRAQGFFAKKVAEEKDKKESKEVIKERFEREKMMEIAKTHLTLLEHLLDGKEYFFDASRPGVLDALVAAHILLITVPPLPNDIFRSLIQESFPALDAHSKGIQSHTFLLSSVPPEEAENLANASPYSSAFGLPRTVSPPSPLRWRRSEIPSLQAVLSSIRPPTLASKSTSKGSGEGLSPKDLEEDRKYAGFRWLWFGLSAASLVGWFAYTGMSISFQVQREEEIDDAEEEEELEELEEEEEFLDESEDTE